MENPLQQNFKGSFLVSGILDGVEFNTNDIEPNENSSIDFITLNISGKRVHVYPFRELVLLKNIRQFIDFNKRYEIVMKVRNYGSFYFAFDYDLYIAMLKEVKEVKYVG